MAKIRTDRDKQQAALFQAWLTPMAGQIGTSNLTKAIYADNLQGGAPRKVVKSWLAASSTISASNAYRVGDALRACGQSWCSGIVALYAAGYLAQFCETLANFARIDESNLSPWYATLSPLAAATGAPYCAAARSLLAEIASNETREQLRTAFFRGSLHGANKTLAAIGTLAKTPAPLTVTEPAVRVALREWALLAADDDTRALLVSDVIGAEIARLEGLLQNANATAALRTIRRRTTR